MKCKSNSCFFWLLIEKKQILGKKWKKNPEILKDKKQIENISDNGNLMNNGQKHPRIKDYVEYKMLGSNEFSKSQIISRAIPENF